MYPIIIPTMFAPLPELAKHRFSAVKMDWSKIPEAIAGFKREQDYQRGLIFDSVLTLDERPEDLDYLRTINHIRDGGQSLRDLIPHEQTLSSVLELVIKEAVSVKKQIIYDAYLRMEQEDLTPIAGFFITLPKKFTLTGSSEQIIRELARAEAQSPSLRRAKLCSYILENLPDYQIKE